MFVTGEKKYLPCFHVRELRLNVSKMRPCKSRATFFTQEILPPRSTGLATGLVTPVLQHRQR